MISTRRFCSSRTPSAVGAVNPDNGFPLWYRDAAGTQLDLCITDPTLCGLLGPVQLVNPAHISAYEAQADVPVGAHLVQIGGKLVRPDKVAAYQAHAADVRASKSSSDDGGIGWTTTGIGIGVFASLLLLAGTFGALWRRGRLSTV